MKSSLVEEFMQIRPCNCTFAPKHDHMTKTHVKRSSEKHLEIWERENHLTKTHVKKFNPDFKKLLVPAFLWTLTVFVTPSRNKAKGTETRVSEVKDQTQRSFVVFQATRLMELNHWQGRWYSEQHI